MLNNTVLFPSGNALDFATAGGTIGWVQISNIHNLNTMADVIAGETNELVDHAIPSPIAYVKEFYNSFVSGDEDAINTWRGMLAVIALQKSNALNITIKEIPLFTDPVTGSPTTLGGVIGEALVQSKDITGYNLVEGPTGTLVPQYKTLSVFCKDDVPFAMFMPGMVICPFKSYPRRLFAGIDWYDDKVTSPEQEGKPGKWLEIRDKITDGPTLSITAQKLYHWIKNLELTVPANNDVLAFENYILGGQPVPVSTPDTAPQPNKYDCGADVWSALKSICPLPVGAPNVAFADKMLFVIPSNNFYDGVYKDEQGNVSDYRIDRSEEHATFTPSKRMLWGMDPLFVIPPIHKEVVESIRSGAAQLSTWDIRPDGDNFSVGFTLNFPNSGEQLKYKRKFVDSEIAWTKSMPYLSLWPYVNFEDDSWKEHYLAIYTDEQFINRAITRYDELAERENCKQIAGIRNVGDNTPLIKITVTPKSNEAQVDEYKCFSEYKDKEFVLLSSTSEPFSLEFSYEDAGIKYSLGSWVIDRSTAPNVRTSAGQRYFVAMDFGTTSTNIYLRKDAPMSSARSISSPGKYLCELFNPYVNNQNVNMLKFSDYIQNYYLFSGSKDALGKIFTYGQNFTTKKNGMALGSTVSNASGRMVKVDDRYILDREEDKNGGIYSGLKMRRPGVATDPNITEATNNFVLNALTCAVLEAKTEGAATIDMRVSYPSENFGATVINNLRDIANDIESKSGLTINLSGATEAKAAGEYFSSMVTGPNAPVPTFGYAIIDIGGGTTDFSFWKQEPADARAEMKSEHSFGYAGNFLVSRTIIQALKDNKNDFDGMWKVAGGTIQERALEKYNSIHLTYPIGHIPTPTYYYKSSTLDFILENCERNDGMLQKPTYSKFLSAIRLKYYSLFYLIATHIKQKADKGEINISKDNFRVCLAGCGSKGLEFCKAGDGAGVFEQNVAEIFKGVLELTDYSVRILPPQTNNKEEVVIGLTLLPATRAIHTPVGSNAGTSARKWGNHSHPAAAATAQAEVAAQPEQTASATVDPESFLQAYMELCEMLSYFENNACDERHILDIIGATYNEATQKYEMNSQEAYSYFRTVYGIVDQQLQHSNYDPDTIKENFALLMLEQMIDQFI